MLTGPSQKFKKNRGKVYRIAREQALQFWRASDRRSPVPRTRVSFRVRVLRDLSRLPQMESLLARETLLTLTVLSTAPENILPLLNAKAATLPW